MKDFICDSCGIVFRDYPSQRKTAKVFCSIPCKAAWNKTVPGYWRGKEIPFFPRPNRNMQGEKNTNWRGGRRLDKTGYVLIWKPQHPSADYHGYVREHRLVVEESIGRYLEPGEAVHHNDGDKQNNDISNLTLMASWAEHQRHHYREKTGAYKPKET